MFVTNETAATQLFRMFNTTYVQLPIMAELLTQHKIATTHQVRFLNTIVVRKSDFLTQTPDI